eukprot:TRINITY_DN2916_c0_g1_i1.p1 TRINITY_DN2916_c0_g1~~TRINITY_DN2916_c0_g1_i1.p1  ORF type:complete len:637 (-),score=78.44 TRINITY_DN2916_c0_g1_i1:200-1888(-)
MAPIHEAALAGDEKVVTELMSYQACKINVKTKKPAKVGAGKTAAQITKSKSVKKALHCKLVEEKKKYNNQVPTCVDIQSAQLNLMSYVHGAMEKHKICERKYNLDYFGSFPTMEERIFSFINTGNNWKSVRNIVANEVGKIDDTKKTTINGITDKMAFFKYLIEMYTQNNYCLTLNSHLREHPIELPGVATKIQKNQKSCRVYTALTNAVLFHATIPRLGKRFTGTTYRGVQLSDKDRRQYTVGSKFAWLSFSSSSSDRNRAFSGCKIFIDNATESPWSPRGIEAIAAYSSEREYLYPCGAQFEVTKLETIHNQNVIHLKLINLQADLQPIQLKYEKEKLNYDTLVNQYNQIYPPIFEEKKLIDTASKELHTLHILVENSKRFENEVIENRSRKVDLAKGTKSYHCRDCNTTCDYPCPESHMVLGRCEFCIPRAEGACTKCQGRCHFTKHSRVGYRIDVELVKRKVVDEAMQAKHAAAVAEFQSKDNEYRTMKARLERDFARLPKGNQLVEDMQKSIREQTNILSVKKNKTWDNYDDILIQLAESRCFVEECRYNLSELELL